MRTKTIGLVAHVGKPGVANLAREVIREFSVRSLRVIVEKETARVAKQKGGGSIAEVARRSDLIVVLGGDGTILNVVAMAGGHLKPIFGINVGSLGFLTCVNSSAYRQAVESIARGQITFTERTLLDVDAPVGGKTESCALALNDAVFTRGELSRLIRLRARVDGESLTEFNADGLIVATPTGSTAYSLSAGGPIMSPDSGALAIAPLCSHVFTNRSIIISDQSIIEVDVTERDYAVYLTVDGREPLRLDTGAVVRITKAGNTLPLAVMPDTSFFSVVRQKLKWSGSNI